jgi:hypothetical protein
MKRKTLIWLALICELFLAGCASHGPTALLVSGNSITYNPPYPSRGWYGNWGMAAPSAATDFSHLTASSFNIPLTIMNLYIERDPEGSLSQIPAIANLVDPGSAVILEYGDDVPNGGVAAFAKAYDQLAAAVKKANYLVCISTWWENPSIDFVIDGVCVSHGGRYVYIGDLRTNPANTDLQTIEYSNPRINGHPRRWGHLHIAQRVYLALRGL